MSLMPMQGLIEKMHNGLIKCPLHEVGSYMPEISPVIAECDLPHSDYVVDAKVHMLMPGQFPCIPNWHGDAIPRNSEGKLEIGEVDINQKMFLWLSGPPFTEFSDGRKVKPGKWIEFNQLDFHRGTVSHAHQWRLFIRLMPASLCARPRKGEDVLRRHSQVYLDAGKFTW